METKSNRALIATSVLRLAATTRATSDARGAELLDAAAAEIERLSEVLTTVRDCGLPLCETCLERIKAAAPSRSLASG